MSLLIDTHLLLWASEDVTLLPAAARRLMSDPDAVLAFSAVSVLEVAIKFARGRDDFVVDPDLFTTLLVGAGYRQLDVTPAHAARVARLPALHGDPFDRLLLAQAEVEVLTLLTSDRKLGAYPGPVRLV